MELASRLGGRPDRFSQLLSKSFRDEHVGQHLLTSSGLTAEEHQELVSLSEQAHGDFREELMAATASLRELLGKGDPLHSVSVVQATSLMTTWGGYYEPTATGGENRVELVASLVASQPASDDGPPSNHEMQQLHDEIEHVVDLLYLFNLTSPRDADPDVAALRFTGAMHWMSIRGSSFADHGKELALAVFSPYDQWMLRTYGFTVVDVIDVGEATEALLTESMNMLLRRAGEFADGVFDYLGNPQKLPAEVRKNVSTDEQREAAAQLAFIDVFSSGIGDAMTFSLDELCAVNPALARERVAAVLRELSIEVGSIEPSAYTGLFDPSPLVERPFLARGDRYMLPVPGMLLRDVFTVLDARLMRGSPGYSKSRAGTLDRLAVDWLASMLPGATTYTNLHYDGNELDGLVLFENMAFVVEGKGSSISFQAQRGDVVRLVDEVRDSVEEALEQGVRARSFILAPGDSEFFDDRGRELLRLADGAVREVQIVNPTIHELAGHGPQLARFRSRGLFKDGEFPWSVYINDLRVIAETCENAAVFLHYLAWRGRLPLGEQVIVADELDLWGAYLFGARFPPLDENGIHHIGNSTTDFDAYYDGLKGRGPKRDKPRKYLEEPVSSFVERMATERPQGWRDASGACLDLSLPELAFVCGRAKEVGRAASMHRQMVEVSFGRGVLIGVPRSTEVEAVLAESRSVRTDASFFVYAKETGKRGEIVWANYGEKISLELSDFETALLGAAPSAFHDD